MAGERPSRPGRPVQAPRQLDGLPAGERARQRLSTHGAANLADGELLALLLGTGIRGTGAHVLAEQLLAHYGSLPELARAHPADLATVPGIGHAKAAAITAAFELARRLPRRKLPTRPVLTSNAIAAIVRPLLAGRTRERLVLLTCDSLHRLTHTEVITEGTAEAAIVPIRAVITAVLRRDAPLFAIAHNHPSGDATPSDSDVHATRILRHAAGMIGLRLLDHIVVTDHTWRRINTRGPNDSEVVPIA